MLKKIVALGVLTLGLVAFVSPAVAEDDPGWFPVSWSWFVERTLASIVAAFGTGADHQARGTSETEGLRMAAGSEERRGNIDPFGFPPGCTIEASGNIEASGLEDPASSTERGGNIDPFG